MEHQDERIVHSPEENSTLGKISVVSGNVIRYEKTEYPLTKQSILEFDEALQGAATDVPEPRYLLVDMKHGDVPSLDIRQPLVDILKHTRFEAVAFFGGSAMIREVAGLIFQFAETPLEFFATEEEAFAWLNEQRESR